ncbi:hypothetical protein MMC10_007764 [Thelotrema lepadinum]|nr:hypothetical protein [Thelotrema lepadinum]
MESASLDLLICTACGTQFDVDRDSGKDECRICDDPRQFIPADGQSFTTLRKLQADKSYRNVFDQIDDNRIISITTEPKQFGIGQRALLLRTPHGNVLWDCVAYLDPTTIEKINDLGGLQCIVISHPHFYTTHVDWSVAFDCPVYTSAEDAIWLHRTNAAGVDRRLIRSATEIVLEGVTAIKTGGHFDGSLVLHWDTDLFIADSLFTVQSAYYHKDRHSGSTSYSFMWSIPNFIPLPPSKIEAIWKAVERWYFTSTYGLMKGMNVHDPNLKRRVLESAKIQIRAEGYSDHPLLREDV